MPLLGYPHCQKCLNNTLEGCEALRDYNKDPSCFARIVHIEDKQKQRADMKAYHDKISGTSSLGVDPMQWGLGMIRPDPVDIPRAEIMAAYHEDTQRGNGKGGGEKEKNKSSKKKGTKLPHYGWDEL